MAEYQALEDAAVHRGLSSLHQRGREIVIEHLAGLDAAETSERIAAVEQELAGLKEVLSHIITLLQRLGYAVIVGSGKESEVANQWVREHMPKRR